MDSSFENDTAAALNETLREFYAAVQTTGRRRQGWITDRANGASAQGPLTTRSPGGPMLQGCVIQFGTENTSTMKTNF